MMADDGVCGRAAIQCHEGQCFMATKTANWKESLTNERQQLARKDTEKGKQPLIGFAWRNPKANSLLFCSLRLRKSLVCSGALLAGTARIPAPKGPCSDPQTALNLELLGPCTTLKLSQIHLCIFLRRGTSPFQLLPHLESLWLPSGTRVVADCRLFPSSLHHPPLPTPFSGTWIALFPAEPERWVRFRAVLKCCAELSAP
ncbi:uncharacterized protein B0H64DRAFT_171186 [Chaetomium fimeti]|uniref:Uncharacterized protein n=1 Tax=Chaetomium fimeti TaxID=1854472 RepID=A0AAE0HH88_9PEZI|nr:hypothetical protein B0H64DRAFT_171186 [Chaetomium fimeti]